MKKPVNIYLQALVNLSYFAEWTGQMSNHFLMDQKKLESIEQRLGAENELDMWKLSVIAHFTLAIKKHFLKKEGD